MSEPSAPARTTVHGVVDPLRLPIPPRVLLWWHALPGTGRIFVGVAGLDVVGRTIGLLAPRLDLTLDPVWLLAQLFPRELLILLPALLLTRRADAGTATPLVLRGAILLALVTLVGPQVETYVGSVGPSTMLAWTVVSLLTVLVKSAAWGMLGIGLLALHPPRPGRNLEGFANLVAGGLVAMAILRLFLTLTTAPPDLGDAAWNGLYQLVSASASIELVALAFLARIVIRGAADTRRPPIATRLAAVAIGVIGVVAVLDVLLALLSLFRTSFDIAFIPTVGPSAMATAGVATVLGGWFSSGLMTSVFLVSFGLGLADTSWQDRPGDLPDEPPAPPEPSWPEPSHTASTSTWHYPGPSETS